MKQSPPDNSHYILSTMRQLAARNMLLFCLLTLVAQAARADGGASTEAAVAANRFTFSGYANVVTESPAGGRAQLIVDDLSLFVTGRINRWVNPFFEAEIAGATLAQENSGLFSGRAPNIILERLYNDSYLTNNLSLRIGKMLTPVGEWNLIHAAPLIWTTTRPLTTYRGFNEYTSGLALLYSPSSGALPEIQLYTQPDGEIIARPKTLVVRTYEHVFGAHANWAIGLNDKLGISLQHAQVNKTGEEQTLAGVNFSKSFGNLSVETEAFTTRITGANAARLRNNEWGGYLQGAYALDAHWNLLGRAEVFADREFSQTSRNTLLGVVYKSAPSAPVWKLEYVHQSGQKLNIETGLYASFSILF